MPVSRSAVWVRNAPPCPLGSIMLAGHIRDSRGVTADPMRVLGQYAIVYLLSGGGEYRDATGVHAEVGAGDLLLIVPGVAHSYGPPPGGHWSELYVVFDGPVFRLWQSGGMLEKSGPIAALQPVDAWSGELSRIAQPPGAPGPMAGLAQMCRLQVFLADALALAAPADATSGEQAWLQRACALLESDMRRDSPLADIAAAMGESYDGFRKQFRSLAGVSPARFRSVRCIDRACELMSDGGLSDKQIAARLGFCDEFHFSHRFSDVVGMSPRQFRTSLPESASTRRTRTYK